MIRITFKDLDISIYPSLLKFQTLILVFGEIGFVIQYVLIKFQKLSDFLKGRINAKAIILVMIFVITIFTSVSVYTLKVNDYQASQIYLNSKQLKRWSQNKNYSILSEISVGNDSTGFTYQSDKLSRDFNFFILR